MKKMLPGREQSRQRGLRLELDVSCLWLHLNRNALQEHSRAVNAGTLRRKDSASSILVQLFT